MNNISVQEWNEKQFENCKHEWNTLLKRSSSDPLFLSWEWMHTWWNAFADPDMQLYLLTATNQEGDLIGIAPLYSTKAKTKKFIVTRRLEFIGNRWRGQATMRTELLEFIAEKPKSKEITKAFFNYLSNDSHWDELILSDLRKDSDTYRYLNQYQLLPRCYHRNAEEYDSFYIETSSDFNDYIHQLGKNTRLRLFNRRKLLIQLGNTQFITPNKDDIENLFQLLNNLHAKRWGSPVFQDKRLEFNVALAKLMDQRDALHFSTVTIDNEPVSIQYNYVVNNHKYNIQAGFEEGFHKKIALGYLHFGYEIENACNSDITTYDLLAGEGKNTSYKKHLTKSSVRIINLQIIRNPIVKFIYRLYDYYSRL